MASLCELTILSRSHTLTIQCYACMRLHRKPPPESPCLFPAGNVSKPLDGVKKAGFPLLAKPCLGHFLLVAVQMPSPAPALGAVRCALTLGEGGCSGWSFSTKNVQELLLLEITSCWWAEAV